MSENWYGEDVDVKVVLRTPSDDLSYKGPFILRIGDHVLTVALPSGEQFIIPLSNVDMVHITPIEKKETGYA